MRGMFISGIDFYVFLPIFYVYRENTEYIDSKIHILWIVSFLNTLPQAKLA